MEHNEFAELLRRIDGEFQLPKNFLTSLLKEDDWSFIVKLHALIEAVITHLLTHSQGDARLQEVFERLGLGGRAGKLAFVNGLGLLTQEQQNFVRALADLRNQLVHRLSKVNFSFPEHIANLDTTKLRKFRCDFASWAKEGNARASWEAAVESESKLLLWAGALNVILDIQLKVATTKAERTRRQSLIDLADQIIANDPELDPDWDGSIA